ncbi:MAG: hypothetical protein IH991_22350 [Planctomycetes bacterium]|nr:hypothetical protein [Planctomycetota bacterium]
MKSLLNLSLVLLLANAGIPFANAGSRPPNANPPAPEDDSPKTDDPPKVDVPPDPFGLFPARKRVPGAAVPKRSWGPEQVIGAPDTPQAGDCQTAWASRTQDGMDEWLELEYAKEVELAAVIIHETYNPGAVYRITAYSKTKMEAELWKGKDPTDTGAARGVSEIKIKQRFKTKRIRIHINSTKVKGWNEIDAVGIKDTKGNVQWAIHARASSSYASNDQPDNGLQQPARAKSALLKAEIEKMRQLEGLFLQQLRALEAQLKAMQQQRILRERELEALEAK